MIEGSKGAPDLDTSCAKRRRDVPVGTTGFEETKYPRESECRRFDASNSEFHFSRSAITFARVVAI
jgi:hypothetical protein